MNDYNKFFIYSFGILSIFSLISFSEYRKNRKINKIYTLLLDIKKSENQSLNKSNDDNLNNNESVNDKSINDNKSVNDDNESILVLDNKPVNFEQTKIMVNLCLHDLIKDGKDKEAEKLFNVWNELFPESKME